MKTHVMLDLETLGVCSDAVVLSIGACYFQPETGEIGNGFNMSIDIEDTCRYGNITASTIKWWLTQSEPARMSVVSGTHTVDEVLDEFDKFLGGANNKSLIWGNGADFDNVILSNLYQNADRVIPWGQYNNRCFRTLKKILAQTMSNEEPPIRQGTHHNALDDAIYQAQMANYICKKYSISLT